MIQILIMKELKMTYENVIGTKAFNLNFLGQLCLLIGRKGY